MASNKMLNPIKVIVIITEYKTVFYNRDRGSLGFSYVKASITS